MILLGGFSVFWMYSRGQRRKLALIQDLSAALEQMAGEIRWRLTPLPDAIEALSERDISGHYFLNVHEYLQVGMPLQEAWKQAFQDLPQELGTIVLRMEWGGDLERQESSIRYVSAQLQEWDVRNRGELRQREKLCAAVTLSAAGLLVLILI